MNIKKYGRALAPPSPSRFRIVKMPIATNISTAAAGIDEKKRFEVLLDSLKDAYKELIDANFKIDGVLLLVLGWFASNKNPLSMLCDLQTLIYFALLFTLAGQFFLYYLFRLLYVRAKESYDGLKNLGHDEILFKRFNVTRGMLWCGIFGQFTMLIGILTSIFTKYIILYEKTCF